ncbi:MAG: hypothetical protein IT263_02825, partial [Saprospiraceae bacterium]|nr:hypothetical protein [Saprospiraceae bacterium]
MIKRCLEPRQWYYTRTEVSLPVCMVFRVIAIYAYALLSKYNHFVYMAALFLVLAADPIYYKPFKEDTEYRYVVSREPNPTGQIDVFSGDSYTYRAIITNDTEMTDKEVIIFYNQRGGSEKIF